jgi:hypothetical protein
VPIEQVIEVSAGTTPVPHLGSNHEGSSNHRSGCIWFALSVEHRPGERTFELGTRPWAMQMVNGARSVLDRRTGQLEHGWLSDGDQLDAQCSQWHAEITLIRNREVAQERAVTAQPTTDADRHVQFGISEQFIHHNPLPDN